MAYLSIYPLVLHPITLFDPERAFIACGAKRLSYLVVNRGLGRIKGRCYINVYAWLLLLFSEDLVRESRTLCP